MMECWLLYPQAFYVTTGFLGSRAAEFLTISVIETGETGIGPGHREQDVHLGLFLPTGGTGRLGGPLNVMLRWLGGRAVRSCVTAPLILLTWSQSLWHAGMLDLRVLGLSPCLIHEMICELFL